MIRCLSPLAILVVLTLALNAHALTYIESSTGLGTPAMEGGNTELEMADIDQDGHIDLLSIGDHGSPYINTNEHGVMVWFGDGTGSWSNFMYGNFGYGGIAVGDVNNDGLLDVGYGMHHNYSGADLGDQILEVALGDGTGTMWTAWDDGLATNGETWGMFGTDFADVDNDGDLDVGSISFGCCAGVHVYLNQGDGSWIQSFGFVSGNSTMEFVFGDVNADGYADFAVGHQDGTVYLGDGEGGFTLADGNLPAGSSMGRPGPDLGDVNGDGCEDVSFTTSTGGVQVWLWSESGVWQSASTGLPVSGPYDVTQLHDMDGDGRVDLAAFGGGTVTVWAGNGGASWTQAATFGVGTPGSCSAFRVGGDADHNGFPDIVLVEESGSWPSYQNHLRFYKETTAATTLAARFVEPTRGDELIYGSVRLIDWACEVPGPDPGEIRLELSTSGTGGPWSEIADPVPNNGRYQWVVTSSSESISCRLRARVIADGDTAWAISDGFTITFPPGTDVVTEAAERAGSGLSVFPNPTHSGAWISFAGVDHAPVTLDVFDVRGRRVFHQKARASAHFYWDGHDRSGQRVASGIYLVRVQSGSRVETKRLLLIR